MLKNFTVIIFIAILLTGFSLGCAKTVKRTLSIEGYAPEEFSLKEDEARLVDRMLAQEPETSPADKCAYWKKKLSEVPPSKKGAVRYAQKAGGGWCAVSGRR